MDRRHNMLRLHIKQQVCLDEFQALVNQRRRELIVTTGPIFQVGCASACRTHPTQLIASAPAESDRLRLSAICIGHLRTARKRPARSDHFMHA